MSQKKIDFFNIVILMLSIVDRLLLGWCWEGIIAIAGPGAGKSSCFGKTLAVGMLQVPQLGALVLVAKSEETQNWIGYARECGREKDLIVFNANSGACFDPLHYEWSRPGRGAGDVESIIELFSTLGSISKPDAGHGHDPFWERGNEQLIAQRNQSARPCGRAHLYRQHGSRHQVHADKAGRA